VSLLRRPNPADANDESAVDPTTGLAQRGVFRDQVVNAIAHSSPTSSHALVAFCDLGLLREVNDNFGPEFGDELLRQSGERLAAIDLPGTQVVRWEGAEFGLVFEKISHVDNADEIARFLIEMLSEPYAVGNERFTITPRVGVALSADNYHDVGEFIRDAHQALVSAREDGAGWMVHDESKRGRYTTRIDESRLAEAIDNEEFILHYQPIFRLDNNMVVGVEALVRWQDASATNSGLVFPADFLPLLEKSGLSVRLGRWIVETACHQAAEWNRSLPDRPAVLVTTNIAARQLASPDFHDTVINAISASGIAPWQLCLDITETALRFNRSGTWAAVRRLKDLGVKIGLDDFGTGVASLTWLRELSLDLLKLDRTFVAGLTINREDRMIVKHVVELAHDLGIVAIAEGVEHPEQAEAMAELHVDLAQGFHYGKPTTPEGIVRLLDPSKVPDDDAWSSDKVLEHPNEPLGNT
jgi:diguanylate cyclase (GGDEF)-like protein